MPKHSTLANGCNTPISLYRAARSQQREPSAPSFQRAGSMDRLGSNNMEVNGRSYGTPPPSRPNLVNILAILDDALSILNGDLSLSDDDDDLLYNNGDQ